jgi:hypothetical protein
MDLLTWFWAVLALAVIGCVWRQVWLFCVASAERELAELAAFHERQVIDRLVREMAERRRNQR